VPGRNDLPDPGSSDFVIKRDEALVDAELTHSFDPSDLVENEPTELVVELAVISNGDGDDVTPSDTVVPTVQIGQENVVTVTSAGCEPEQAKSLTNAIEAGCDFHVPTQVDRREFSPTTSMRFDVTPLHVGDLALNIKVEAIGFVPGTDEPLKLSDETITVGARAHPGRETLQLLEERAVEALTIGIDGQTWENGDPISIELGHSAEITAELSIPGDVDPDLVTISELTLQPTNEQSAGVTLDSPGSLDGRQFTQTWSAIPDEPGTYVLSFLVDASVEIGDIVDPLSCCTNPLAERTLTVQQPTATESPVARVWNGTVSLAAGIATLIAGGGAVYGLVRRRRREETA
jgi:hypothetical protein